MLLAFQFEVFFPKYECLSDFFQYDARLKAGGICLVVLRRLSGRCHALPVGEEDAVLDEAGPADGGEAVKVAIELGAGFDCVASRVLRALAGLAGGFFWLSVCVRASPV